MHINIRYFVVTILVLLLTSCVTKNYPPPLEFEEEYLNDQVMLHAFAQQNSFRTMDTLFITMTFRTDTNIVFPNNYNLRLFVREGKNWREIQEKPVERLPAGDFVFSPLTSNQMPGFFIEPELEDVRQKYLLRVYVSGEMMDDENPKTVAAFLDINLKP